MAVLDGYLSGPLYHRAAYAAQQLLALTEMMAWREGTHVAHTLHLAELFRLADQAGLLADPELATRRMKAVLALRGIEA